jgi:hypothetical protein
MDARQDDERGGLDRPGCHRAGATKPSGSQRFYEMAGSTDKTLKLY